MTTKSRPLEVVEVFESKAFYPAYGSLGAMSIAATEETAFITFDDKGGDFLEEMVRAAGNLSPEQNRLTFMDNAMSSYVKFKREYPDPTVEEYTQFRKEIFATPVRERIKKLLDYSETENLTPEQIELISIQK